MKAKFNDTVIAESNETIIVEGNHYFPPNSINKEYFETSKKTTTCLWKGEASYYSVSVNGKTSTNSAWYYPHPKEKAQKIKGYVAFWKAVSVVD